MHVGEGFDLRDDDRQHQLISWTKSGRSFFTALGAVCKVAQQASVAGDALKLRLETGPPKNQCIMEKGSSGAHQGRMDESRIAATVKGTMEEEGEAEEKVARTKVHPLQ